MEWVKKKGKSRKNVSGFVSENFNTFFCVETLYISYFKSKFREDLEKNTKKL